MTFGRQWKDNSGELLPLLGHRDGGTRSEMCYEWKRDQENWRKKNYFCWGKVNNSSDRKGSLKNPPVRKWKPAFLCSPEQRKKKHDFQSSVERTKLVNMRGVIVKKEICCLFVAVNLNKWENSLTEGVATLGNTKRNVLQNLWLDCCWESYKTANKILKDTVFGDILYIPR